MPAGTPCQLPLDPRQASLRVSKHLKPTKNDEKRIKIHRTKAPNLEITEESIDQERKAPTLELPLEAMDRFERRHQHQWKRILSGFWLLIIWEDDVGPTWLPEGIFVGPCKADVSFALHGDP